jgi:hypothetical protein
MAHVGSPNISATYAGLLSVWAVSYATLQLSAAIGEARRKGKRMLAPNPGTAAHEAYRLVESARDLIRNRAAGWPSGLPTPDPSALADTHPWRINNLFLGATAWILLHEVAHLKLNHEITLPADMLRNQEFEADTWATQWVLGEAPPTPPLAREFRLFCVATGLAWNGLVQQIRGQDSVHPSAAQRLLNSSQEFQCDELSPGIEMAGDVLKALFDPSVELPETEHPLEAFDQIMLHLRGTM